MKQSDINQIKALLALICAFLSAPYWTPSTIALVLIAGYFFVLATVAGIQEAK